LLLLQVMRRHEGETTAAFMVTEEQSVRRMVHNYVQHMMSES
jgi:hypothetical protein